MQQTVSLTSVLQAQLQALSHIEEILELEHAALENRDPNALLEIADSKNRALAELGNLEHQRKQLARTLEAQDIGELQRVAARCRQMNTHNAALLSAQHQHVNRLLGLLRGAGGDDRPAAYDAKGRTAATSSQRLRLTQV